MKASTAERKIAALAQVKADSTSRHVERLVFSNKRYIARAIRNGHAPKAIAEALELPLRTLRRHLREQGLFWRTPRSEYSRKKLAQRTRRKRAE